MQKGGTLKVMEEFNKQGKQPYFYKYCRELQDTTLYAPVPCAHRTHNDITFTAHHCQYYVEQQWLFEQLTGTAEKILDTNWMRILHHYKLFKCHSTFKPVSTPHTPTYFVAGTCLVAITISPILRTSHYTII